MKVLFMQEQPFLSTALKLTMRSKGYEVVFKKDNTTTFEEVNPGVVVADISNGNNLTCIEEAKRHNVPVIVVSNGEKEEELQIAFDHGADDYICLPLCFSELALRVNKLTRTMKQSA